MAGSRLLLVADDRSLPDGLTVGNCAGALSALDADWTLETVTDSAEVRDALDETVVCVVCGLSLDAEGLDVLQEVRDRNATVPVIQLVASGTERVPVEALALDGVSYCRLDAAADPTTDLTGTVETALSDAASGVADSVPGPSGASESGGVYRELVRNVPDPVYMLDEEGYITMVNEALLREGGYDRESFLGSHITEIVPMRDFEHGVELIVELLGDDTKHSETFELEIEHADGTTREYEDHLTVVTDEDGEFAGSVGIVRDIQERKERERELEQYETVVETVDDLVYAVDDEGHFQFVNEAQESMTGYGRDQLLGEHVSVLMGEESRAKARERIAALRESDQGSVTYERTATTADGEQIYCEDNMALLPSPDGDFRGTAGIIRDITERKERERELEQYETLVQAVPDTMWATDENGYFTFVNDAGIERFDYDEVESGEIHFSESIADEDLQKFVEAHRRLLSDEYDTGQKAVIEYTAVTQDGRRFPAETHFSLMDTDDDEGTPGAGIVRDVTARKQRQERLQVLNRVLRHNLRNDLTAVISGSDVIAERMRAICNDEVSANIAETNSEVSHEIVEMSEEIRQIGKALERESIESPRTDAVEVIESVVADYRDRHPAATIGTDLPGEAAVEADHSLELVVEQLVENAIVHNDSDRPWVKLTITERDRDRGDWYELQVTDDGPGIPEHERVVVDEDTEVTPLQHGSGIGLWAVVWVVNSFDGNVDFDTDASGSVVSVTLRTAAQAATER
jgi:PAS domain S-box-containing protein